MSTYSAYNVPLCSMYKRHSNKVVLLWQQHIFRTSVTLQWCSLLLVAASCSGVARLLKVGEQRCRRLQRQIRGAEWRDAEGIEGDGEGGFPLPSWLRGLGEHRKLPQWGQGWIPVRKRIWCTLELSEIHWWQSFWVFHHACFAVDWPKFRPFDLCSWIFTSVFCMTVQLEE